MGVLLNCEELRFPPKDPQQLRTSEPCIQCHHFDYLCNEGLAYPNPRNSRLRRTGTGGLRQQSSFLTSSVNKRKKYFNYFWVFFVLLFCGVVELGDFSHASCFTFLKKVLILNILFLKCTNLNILMMLRLLK